MRTSLRSFAVALPVALFISSQALAVETRSPVPSTPSANTRVASAAPARPTWGDTLRGIGSREKRLSNAMRDQRHFAHAVKTSKARIDELQRQRGALKLQKDVAEAAFDAAKRALDDEEKSTNASETRLTHLREDLAQRKKEFAAATKAYVKIAAVDDAGADSLLLSMVGTGVGAALSAVVMGPEVTREALVGYAGGGLFVGGVAGYGLGYSGRGELQREGANAERAQRGLDRANKRATRNRSK